MELTMSELRDAALIAISDRFAASRLVATPTVGAIVTNKAQTAFARIEITDEQLLENKHRIAGYLADRCDAAEIQVTGQCRA